MRRVLFAIGAVVFAAIAGLIFNASLTFFPSLLIAIVGAVVVVLAWRAINNSMGRATRV